MTNGTETDEKVKKSSKNVSGTDFGYRERIWNGSMVQNRFIFGSTIGQIADKALPIQGSSQQIGRF